jgi:hypothetical protein
LPLFSAGKALAQETPLVFTDQGSSWTAETRSDFYGRDQGSKMIPLDWLRSLKQANGEPFLSDNLTRYGYLANPANTNGLPIGFTASGPAGIQTVGMTCSACHTRQIIAEGKSYRIDGGPAIADFQRLLSDLDVAVGNVMSSDAAFAAFAAAVLGSPTPDPEDVSVLHTDVDAWYRRYHMLITRALPTQPWGPARLDAVGMIFDRLTGLDLGPPPNLLISENILPADAPVRYPFVWNAPQQDQTQWSGFADNGSDVLALGRNVGEVLGVFGVFEPKKDGLVINFLNNNSTNFDGLARAEELIKLIGPPKWPWPVDSNLAAQGEAIFERSTDQGGCRECHDIAPGKMRFLLQQTWSTPVRNVGTDTRQYDILARNASTGALQGAFIPFVTAKPLNQTDLAINVLKTSVVGSIAEHVLNTGGGANQAAEAVATAAAPMALRPAKLIGRLPLALRDLQGSFHLPGEASTAAPAKGAYEARVLQGVWAVAPYLHNGSVPTLAELLKPAAQRVTSFKVGPAYDTVNVGLATDQQQSGYELTTSDCSDLNSGNSRCGHEYGTSLSDAEKKALIEYLKTL